MLKIVYWPGNHGGKLEDLRRGGSFVFTPNLAFGILFWRGGYLIILFLVARCFVTLNLKCTVWRDD
jgi:hypothetical protein